MKNYRVHLTQTIGNRYMFIVTTLLDKKQMFFMAEALLDEETQEIKISHGLLDNPDHSEVEEWRNEIRKAIKIEGVIQANEKNLRKHGKSIDIFETLVHTGVIEGKRG